MKKKRSQFAVEFAVLIAFMFLMFVGFIAVISSRISEAKEVEKERIAEDLAELAKNEIEFAKTVTDGYVRTFNIPSNVGGESYSMNIFNNRELNVTYLGKEHVEFLPEKVCGDTFFQDNVIDKIGGVICVNSNLNEDQCQQAVDDNLCDGIDNDVLPGTKCCCCSRFNLCCPECSDNLDNEVPVGDGLIDYGQDPQCVNENDDDETNR